MEARSLVTQVRSGRFKVILGVAYKGYMEAERQPDRLQNPLRFLVVSSHGAKKVSFIVTVKKGIAKDIAL